MARSTGLSKKRRTPKSVKILRIGILAAIIVVLVIVYLACFTKTFGSPSELTKIDSTSAEIASTSSRIYYINGATLYAADTSGKEIWNVKYSSGDLSLTASDELICVYDESFASVLDPTKNALFTVPDSDFKILKARCGDDCVALLCALEGETPTNYIRIFDKGGAEIYRSEFKTEDVLNYGLSEDSNTLWALTLDTSGVYPISRITTSSPAQNALTGTIEVTDQLISNVFYFDKEMFITGSKSLVSYDTFGTKGSETLIYGLKCIDTASRGNNYMVAYAPRTLEETSDAFTMRVLGNIDGQEVDTLIGLPNDVVAVHVSPTRIYCFLEDSAYVYKSTGEFERQIDFEVKITGTKKLSSDQLLLMSGRDIYYLYIQ